MKNLCLILSLLFFLTLLPACKAAGDAQLNSGGQQTDPAPTSEPSAPSTPTSPTVPPAPPFRETIPVSEPQPDKLLSPATLEDDFSDNEILVGVYPQWNLFDFTVEDFSDVGCIAMREIFKADHNNSPSRMFVLTLDQSSKENVLSCIKILEVRPEFYFVGVNLAIPNPEFDPQ